MTIDDEIASVTGHRDFVSLRCSKVPTCGPKARAVKKATRAKRLPAISFKRAIGIAVEALGDRMTKDAACEYLGVCARTLERTAIPKLHWKGRVWYSKSSIDAYIKTLES
jgi:hypothetical protein